MNLKLQL